MTDHEDIRKALAAATPGPWETCNRIDVFTANDAAKRGKPGTHVADCDPSSDKDRERAIADAHLIANAPQWLAGLLAECEALKAQRDRYERALHLIAPDGLPLQLTLGEPADGMPMFGRVSLVSPYLVATKPEGPDASFAGAREVYQYTYDEDTQHEAEHCTVGYFMTEDWLCERDEGAEEKYDEALARAELAETKHASCEAHLRLVTEERERLADQREDWRARSIANEERAEAAERERDDALRDVEHIHARASRAESDRAEVAKERASLLAENARLREEVEARPAITREDAAAFVRGAFVKFRDQVHRDSDDGRAVVVIEEALRAHASQPQCPSCHGTRTVMDADHDSRVLTADDCPACSQPKGDGGSDV